MSKIKTFLWQLCHKTLLVTGNMNPACPICLDDIESTDHLIKDCHMAKKVWESGYLSMSQ